MSPTDPPTSDAERLDEDLVSYLDGQLDTAEAQRIEQRLADDEQARRRLQQLAQSWDLLDQLPRSVVSESFTRSTVEMVAIAAEKELAEQTANLPRVRRNRWLLAGSSIVAAGLLGFFIAWLIGADPNARLLNDLPVIVNLELYKPIGDIAILHKLSDENLLAEDPTDSAKDDDSGQATAVALVSLPASYGDRRQYLAKLTAAEKEELHDEYEKFMALPATEQEKLRRLDRAMTVDPHAQRLARIAVNYHQWLSSLSAVERVDLLSLDDTDRVERIKSLRHEQLARVARQFGGAPLQPSDDKVLHDWMRELVTKHRDELLRDMPPDQRAKYDAQPEIGKIHQLSSTAWQRWRGATVKGLASDAEIKQLVDKLSPDAQKFLESKPLEEQRKTIQEWVHVVARARMPGFNGRNFPPMRPEDFDRLFERLSSEQQAHLRTLPPDQQRVELWQYLQPRGPGPKNHPRTGHEGPIKPDKPASNPSAEKSPDKSAGDSKL